MNPLNKAFGGRFGFRYVVRARFHGDELIVTAVGDDGHSCAAAQRGDAP
ncbi:hypothetical protein ACFVYV_05440 [Streptomyces mirabilis]